MLIWDLACERLERARLLRGLLRVPASARLRFPVSPCPRVSVSPCLRVSASPRPRVSVSPCHRVSGPPLLPVAPSPSPCRTVPRLHVAVHDLRFTIPALSFRHAKTHQPSPDLPVASESEFGISPCVPGHCGDRLRKCWSVVSTSRWANTSTISDVDRSKRKTRRRPA